MSNLDSKILDTGQKTTLMDRFEKFNEDWHDAGRDISDYSDSQESDKSEDDFYAAE